MNRKWFRTWTFWKHSRRN